MRAGGDRSETPSPPGGRVDEPAEITEKSSLLELSQRVASLVDERDAIEEELKRVKRKYRRATTDAQTAKHEVTSLTQQLTDARARLAEIERRSIAGFFARIAQSHLVSRLKPRRSLKSRRAEQIELVRKSHLFDGEWYLATYPDIAEAGIDPAVHYVVDGWSEGRDPGPNFSSSRYLKANRDVAQSASNPLLHYLEHGLAEGRSAGVGGGGGVVPRRSVEDFGPAAGVYRSPVTKSAPVRWRRHYELDASRATLRIGSQAGGYYPAEGIAAIADALRRFWRLSGLEGGLPLANGGAETDVTSGPAMLDGWFAGQSLFRARWTLNGGPARVIRGFQRGRDGTVGLIGEAFVTSSLDIADFPAAHPLLPIFFLVCRPDGECVGATNLFFPSLCRGGLNYAELLLEGSDDGKSPVDLGEQYAQALEAILTEEASALVRVVQVDLAGADGTRPMFQSHCQDWLNWTMRVDVGEAIASGATGRPEIRFLSDRASGPPGHHRERSSSSARLVLPSDSMPTIAILVAVSDGEGSAEPAPSSVSMIVVHPDPAKPALALAVPRGLKLPLGRSASAFPLAFPRIEGAPTADRDVPAAIRTLPERGLADSELLQPLARPLPILPDPVTPREAIVAIEPALWRLPALEAGLAALGLQDGSETVTICTIGTVDPQRRAIIERAFAGRTSGRINVHAFVEGLRDVDVIHLGPDIILHDNRTLKTFQAILTGAGSASCPLLTGTKHGKNWSVAVADAGKARPRSGEPAPLPLARHAEMLWRSTFPVWHQPHDLWAARPALLRNAPEESAEAHLLCGWVSASYWDAERSEERATLCLPPARADLSVRVAELVG